MITSSISCSYILYIMIYQSLITQTMIHYCITLIVSRVLYIEILHSYPITPPPVLHHGPGLVADPWWCNWLEAWRAVSSELPRLITWSLHSVLCRPQHGSHAVTIHIVWLQPTYIVWLSDYIVRLLHHEQWHYWWRWRRRAAANPATMMVQTQDCVISPADLV